MRYALFSDIHGNFYAFEAMMNKLASKNIEGYLFCGDLTGYYYQAAKIVKIIKQLPNFYAVRGNHDQFFLETSINSIKQHTAEDIEVVEYIKSLPEVIAMKIGNFNISMLHGSPKSPLSGRIYPNTVLNIEPLPYDFLFIGHTHYQMIRLHAEKCRIINPGSLGQPRDGKGFSYCIVDFITGEVEYNCVNFDLSLLVTEIAEKDPENPYLFNVLKRGGNKF